jgi:hypothetical protein
MTLWKSLRVAQAIATLIVFVAIAVFIQWYRSPPPNARHLQQLLSDLERFKAATGAYPTSCASFTSFSNLAKVFKVYTGERQTNGVVWEPREVSDHHFSVLVDDVGYEIFLPVGRMKPISHSSFPVWRYSSAERKWQKGKIHWSFRIDEPGSYWSIN